MGRGSNGKRSAMFESKVVVESGAHLQLIGYLCMLFLAVCVDKCCVLTSAESESVVLSVCGVATSKLCTPYVYL